MKLNKINFYYIDKYGKKVEYFIDRSDLKTFKLIILERSRVEQLGDIYMQVDEEGNYIKLDYYNL